MLRRSPTWVTRVKTRSWSTAETRYSKERFGAPFIFEAPDLSHPTTSEVTLADAEATEELGRKLASAIGDRMVVALIGPLGAGKTTFAKGFAKGLHVEEVVSSPTFTMMNEYVSGRIPLYHLDLYRLREDGSASDAASGPVSAWVESELEELLQSKGVILIEWANFINEWIAHQDCILVELNYSTKETSTGDDNGMNGESGRKARLSAFGVASARVVEAISIV